MILRRTRLADRSIYRRRLIEGANPSPSLSEPGAAGDTLTATLSYFAALEESANAADAATVGQAWNASLQEGSNAADAVATPSWSAALQEGGGAADSVAGTGANFWSAALTEGGAAQDQLRSVTKRHARPFVQMNF